MAHSRHHIQSWTQHAKITMNWYPAKEFISLSDSLWVIVTLESSILTLNCVLAKVARGSISHKSFRRFWLNKFTILQDLNLLFSFW